MRPFNWVQWFGVAMLGAGIVLAIAMIGAAFDVAWLKRFLYVPAVVPIVVGNLLIYSRRYPGDSVSELQRTRNQRLLIITVAICTAILGAAVAIQFSGAN